MIEFISYPLGKNLHSFDSYYSNVQFVDSTLVVPYINLGLYEHKLNPTSELKYLDRAYLVAENLTYFKVYKQSPFIGASEKEGTFFFGGDNLDENSFVDMEFDSENSYLLIPNNFRFSTKLWIPIHTPNFPANMNRLEVEELFNLSLLPDNVKRLISGSNQNPTSHGEK